MNAMHSKKIQDFANLVKKSPTTWDCEKLCNWIEEILQFPEYLVALRKKNISGKKMVLIIDSVDELKKLGFTKIGPRRILMQQFNYLMSRSTLIKPKKPTERRHLSFDDIKSKIFQKGSTKKSKSSTSENLLLFSEEEMDPSIIKEMEGCGEKVFEWKSKEVSTWLKGLGLSSLIEVFEKNKIHGDILLDVTENTLKELGITSVGVTKKILNSIERIQPEYIKNKENKEKEEKEEIITPRKSNTDLFFLQKENQTIKRNSFDIERLAKKWDVNLVCNWIESIGFSEYSSNFRKNEIDGSILFNLSKDDLSEIGIESIGHQKKMLSEINNLKN